MLHEMKECGFDAVNQRIDNTGTIYPCYANNTLKLKSYPKSAKDPFKVKPPTVQQFKDLFVNNPNVSAWSHNKRFPKCDHRTFSELVAHHDLDKRRALVKKEIEDYFTYDDDTKDINKPVTSPSILCLQETQGWQQFLYNTFNKDYMIIQDPKNTGKTKLTNKLQFFDESLGVACMFPKKDFELPSKSTTISNSVIFGSDNSTPGLSVQHGALIMHLITKKSKKHILTGTLHLLAPPNEKANFKDHNIKKKANIKIEKRKKEIDGYINTMKGKRSELAKTLKLHPGDIKTIFGGDLNTQWRQPDVVNSSVWRTAEIDHKVKKLDLGDDFEFSDIDGKNLNLKDNVYTTKVEGFKGKIDHIMTLNIGEKWGNSIHVVKGKGKTEIRGIEKSRKMSLPNDRWPSDHLMLKVEVLV